MSILIIMTVEELLATILGVLRNPLKPTTIIRGYTEGISTDGKRLTEKPTPIRKAVTVRVRDLGTGTYIALGDVDEQPFQLSAVDASLDIDWIDDLRKVVVSTDAGDTGVVEYLGG